MQLEYVPVFIPLHGTVVTSKQIPLGNGLECICIGPLMELGKVIVCILPHSTEVILKPKPLGNELECIEALMKLG